MSANSVNPHSCSVCGAEGHGALRCTELAPPPDGFWKGQRMPDEDGDECRRIRCAKRKVFLLKMDIRRVKFVYKNMWKKSIHNRTKTLKMNIFIRN